MSRMCSWCLSFNSHLFNLNAEAMLSKEKHYRKKKKKKEFYWNFHATSGLSTSNFFPLKNKILNYLSYYNKVSMSSLTEFLVDIPHIYLYIKIIGSFFAMSLDISTVQSLSPVRLFVTPWIAAHQACLSITISPSSLKLMFIESVMPSSHLILCRPLLLLPPIPPSVRVFSNESTLCVRWPKYWSFSFSISPSKEHPGLISFRMEWLDLLESKGLSRVFSNTTVQKHQFFGAQPSSQSNPHIHTWPQEKP